MRAERSSADTRNKILEVAEHLFAKEGYAGAHLQNIASRVGVQKTALYYYFPSKSALYEAVMYRMLESFDRTVSEALGRPGRPEERLERLLDAINDLLAERRNYSQILIRIMVDRVHVGGELSALIEKLIGRLLAFFREGIESGAFARQSTRHLFQSSMGAMVFHYATGEFGASVLGVEDLFTRSAVSWRREEMKQLALRAILREPPPSNA